MLKKWLFIFLFLSFTCLLSGESQNAQSENRLRVIIEVGKTCDAIILQISPGEKQGRVSQDIAKKYFDANGDLELEKLKNTIEDELVVLFAPLKSELVISGLSEDQANALLRESVRKSLLTAQEMKEPSLLSETLIMDGPNLPIFAPFTLARRISKLLESQRTRALNAIKRSLDHFRVQFPEVILLRVRTEFFK